MSPNQSRNSQLSCAALVTLAFCACTENETWLEPNREELEAPLAFSPDRMSHRARAGKHLFEGPFEGSNGRSCATCHVLEEGTTLRVESVQARWEANPEDPLFHPLDADDPDASQLTFEHLKKGLVRVILPLPDNMDIIDFEGNVTTPPDRKIFVWRGVPTVVNTALTAPYQYDGRLETLEEQAQAAILAHGEGPQVSRRKLGLIADFQRNLFSSPRARFVSELLDYGFPVEKIPSPERYMSLSEQEKRGRELYESACESCHGGATTHRIVDREVHDFFFPELKPDGNVRFEIVPGVGPVPVRLSRPDQEILNTGYGLATYFGQIGLVPAFNDSLPLPQYRFRFYEDGTRRKPLVDLPPKPVTISGDPFDPRPALDENGAPIVGPNLVPQLFTTDPGRAVITGDPADFEAFDVPQLRGIAGTAPYFHDNSSGTLEDVIDIYSRFVLDGIPPLEMPAQHPPETPGGPTEVLSPAEKLDLLAFLKRL